MDDFHVYKDIEARTGGEIYVGVVVNAGKCTRLFYSAPAFVQF